MGFSLNYTGADARIGGTASFIWGGNGATFKDDNLYIWAKPFGDLLQVNVGSFNWEALRGPGTDGDFDTWINGPGANGDAVFQRVQPRGGVLFLSKPIEALSIYISLDPGYMTFSKNYPLSGPEANEVYRKITAGFGYDIAGIGLARAQYIGDTSDVTWGGGFTGNLDMDELSKGNWVVTYAPTVLTINAPRIEAAFKLTAVEGLTVDLGGKIFLPVEEDIGWDVTFQKNFELNAAGNFKAGDFGVQFGVYTSFGGSVVTDQTGVDRMNFAPTFRLTLGPNFYLAGLDATLGVELGLKVKGDEKIPDNWGPVGITTAQSYGLIASGGKTTDFAFGAWISKDFGPGHIKTGLSYAFPTYADTKANTAAYFSWPIILELGF
jgi:hypothetical protein